MVEGVLCLKITRKLGLESTFLNSTTRAHYVMVERKYLLCKQPQNNPRNRQSSRAVHPDSSPSKGRYIWPSFLATATQTLVAHTGPCDSPASGKGSRQTVTPRKAAGWAAGTPCLQRKVSPCHPLGSRFPAFSRIPALIH